MTGLTRLDRVATVRARIGWKALTSDEYVDDGYAFLSTPNIKGTDIDFENVNYITPFRYEESPELKLQVHDVLLAKDGSTLGIANCVRSLPRPATVNGSIAVLRPHAIESRFLSYWLQGNEIQGRIQELKDGMGVPHLFQQDIRKLPVPEIALEEQRRVACFLDDQVARIDRIVAARREQVEGARAMEQSLLTRALLASTDTLAPLRHLGVTVTTGPFGTAFAATEYVEDGVPMINPTHIKDGVVRPDPNHSVSSLTASRLARHRLRAGDLVVSRKGDLGRAALIRQAQDGWICGSDSIALHARNRAVEPKMLDLLLKLGSIRDQLLSQSSGATIANLNEGNLLSLRVPVLTGGEQRKRVAVADEVRRWARSTVALLECSIERLLEYKHSLITAAVTGELDVTTAGSGVPW